MKRESFAGWLEYHYRCKRKLYQERIKGLLQQSKREKTELKKLQESFLKAQNKPKSIIVKNLLQKITWKKENITDTQRIIKKLRKEKKSIKKIKQPNVLYKKLLKHNQVTGIIVDGNYLRISTKNLKHQTVGGRKWLGKYMISIHYNDFDCLEIENLSWSCNGFEHFHIEDKHPCFGDYGESLENYFSSGELYLLIDSLTQYLVLAHTSHDRYISPVEFFRYRKPRKLQENNH